MENKILHPLIVDNIYKKDFDEYRLRDAVRGFIYNDLGQVAIIHIKGLDQFGDRDHFEFPGGGIEKGENEIEALKREMKEEIGYEIDNIRPIGIISNQYNLLKRIDRQHFYLAHATKFVGQHLLDYERNLFKEIIFYDIDKLLNMYETFDVKNVGKIIHKRDYIVAKEAIKILNERKKDQKN